MMRSHVTHQIQRFINNHRPTECPILNCLHACTWLTCHSCVTVTNGWGGGVTCHWGNVALIASETAALLLERNTHLHSK